MGLQPHFNFTLPPIAVPAFWAWISLGFTAAGFAATPGGILPHAPANIVVDGNLSDSQRAGFIPLGADSHTESGQSGHLHLSRS